MDCLLHSCKGLYQGVDDKMSVKGVQGIRGLRQGSCFTGLIQRKDSGVSFWMEGKQNAWERAKGGSTLRWIQM